MTEQKQRNVDSQHRFRATHRRVDYAPRPAIWAIIEQHLFGDLGKSITGVIDRLIVAGHQAITGNLKELDIAGTNGTEHTVQIHHRPLTPRQEQFACTVATTNQSLTKSYRQVYKPENAKAGTVNTMAARVAALPHVAARTAAIREGMAAALVEKTAFTRADAIAEVGRVMEDAMARGQMAAAVRALTLRAELAGFRPSSRKARKSWDAQGSRLNAAEEASLMKLAEELRAREAAKQVGAAKVPEGPVAPQDVIE